MSIETYHSDEFIGRWVSGNLSEKELQEFTSWLENRPEKLTYFKSLKRIYKAASRLHAPRGMTSEERWEKLSAARALPDSRPRRFSAWTYAAAAIVLAGVGLYLWYPVSKPVVVATKAGETRLVVLPDSSTIRMNTLTSIRYDRGTWEKGRFVEINGEAFFDVRKTGVSFKVVADGAVTEVLGTTFNVMARENRLEVVCVTGSVEVGPVSGDGRVTLTPGLATRRIGASRLASAYPVDTSRKTGWIRGETYFDREPLTSVFGEVERQFGVRVVLRRDLSGLTFTGKIDRASLTNTLYILRVTADLNITRGDDSTLFVQ